MEKQIHILPPGVAERIAAGEIIERPASVVKELVENSLDAGATEISVFLQEGGKELIEILDNGHGMSPENLVLCIERHATSKLKDLDDLEKIHTLGFRGEALPSVAAVADLSIVSRSGSADTAYELRVGDITQKIQRPILERVTFGQFNGLPHGTRIQVRGLFAQIPARLKFLRSQAAEVSQVREWLEKLALAYPYVGFSLKSDDRTILNLRPQPEIERVRTVLSDGDDFPVVTGETEQDGFRDVGLKIRAHWLQGMSVPNGRKLIQTVNSRVVKDRIVQQAIMNGFRQALLPGQYPALAVYIDVNPAAIDVNVHPTKMEIKFLDSRKIFQAIETLVSSMIAQRGAPAMVPAVSRPSPSTQFQFQRPPTWTASTPSLFSREAPADVPIWPPSQSIKPNEEISKSHPFQGARWIGILFNTYLIFENPDEIVLIDQHAAHERIRYEKIRKKAGSRNFSSQALLLPEAVKFSPEMRRQVEGRLYWFEKLGFEVELFGEDTALFRAIPTDWGTDSIKVRLKNLLSRMLELETPPTDLLLDEALFEALASEACHSAIRAGDRLFPEEAQSLVNQLFQCEHPWNCPHGRPTVVKIQEGKIEEWFQRKV